MSEALAFARVKHTEAVQTALENYPIGKYDMRAAASIDAITLNAHQVATSSSLPDFEVELSKTVFVTDPPLLSAEECDEVVGYAEQHFQETANGEWSLQDSGQYKVAGFYLKQIPAVHEWFLQKVKTKLFPVLQKAFPDFIESPDDLCVDNSYLFKYTPETGRRTEIHTDSGCLSFTIALNSKSEYEGGGTWFDGLGVLEMDKGQVTFRPGGLKHCGYAVTKGTRYIIGGFCMHKRKVEPVRMLLTHGLHSVDLLEASLVLNPGVDSAYNILAGKYDAQGKVDLAQKALEYCLANVNAKAVESSYSLGSLLMRRDNPEKALRCMKLCLEIDPFDTDAMMGVAQCSSILGDADTEKKFYQQIIDTPGASDDLVATAYCNLGVLHEGEDIELQYYRSSIDRRPNHYFEPKYSLASAFAARKQWENAIEAYQQSLDGETDTENRRKALTSMYQCVVRLLQTRNDRPATRDAMTKLFQKLMGETYYDEMAKMQQSVK